MNLALIPNVVVIDQEYEMESEFELILQHTSKYKMDSSINTSEGYESMCRVSTRNVQTLLYL